MPSSSAKQHRFMQAVAHSPSFAKKAGVSQSVGKDFSAADKGRTFSKGGTMKIRKFADAGYVDGEDGNQYRDYDPDKTYSGRSFDDETGGLTENTPTRSTAKAARAAPARTTTASAPAQATAGVKNDIGPKQAKSNELAKIAPMLRKEGFSSGFLKYYDPDQNARELARTPRMSSANKPPANDPLEVFSQAARARRAKKLQDELAALDKEAGKASRTFKKGGDIMESKKMMGMKKGGMPPEVMAAMMAKRAAGPQPMRRPPPGGMPPPAQPPMGMKKGGMPMKDGKPSFMQKKMMGGGMAYAKGGGIESRGKTKGTIIRMAAGGSVSSRADGIAMRGKTRGKMV